MKLIDKLKFQFWDDIGLVMSLLKKWRPKNCQTEKEWENSLYDYLCKKLDEILITKQYAIGRVRADLAIADKIIVELKFNFDSTAKYQRLIGQLSEYEKWNGHMVILLCGHVDKNLKKQLEIFLKNKGLIDDDWSESKVTVFQK